MGRRSVRQPYDAAVTQITDGAPSSSLSCPSIVVAMLDSFMLEPGRRVLELGAGTGWNAALLTWRAGSGRVVSIEVDDKLARQAKERLDVAGTDGAVVAAFGPITVDLLIQVSETGPDRPGQAPLAGYRPLRPRRPDRN
ncbi:protein-L-isoaspartate O-methyltransferase family protein [Streptomyces malaysiensis]|uniref:protein-L-isoaspartate O-methyltransferase family protein n=1 Tax=Streptomyces malaysiensis TaxID=92644 RepID=UPI0034140AEA